MHSKCLAWCWAHMSTETCLILLGGGGKSSVEWLFLGEQWRNLDVGPDGRHLELLTLPVSSLARNTFPLKLSVAIMTEFCQLYVNRAIIVPSRLTWKDHPGMTFLLVLHLLARCRGVGWGPRGEMKGAWVPDWPWRRMPVSQKHLVGFQLSEKEIFIIWSH